ncbi:MAG: hypothetical protein ACJAZO_003478 [Myxococcota bacterium]|jgi:hypothetical protein
MRSLFALASITALASLSACGGETCSDGSDPVDDECPCEDGTYPSDNAEGECITDLDCAIGEIESNGVCQFQCADGSLARDETDCPINLDPVAVGFEFDGVWDGAALIGPIVEGQDGPVELIPLVLVTFTNADYFTAGGNEVGNLNSCEAYATFDVVAAESVLDADGEAVWTDFDTTLSILPTSWDADDLSCATALDQDIWGSGGADLLDAFTLFRYGIGFGPQTQYLADAWQDEEGEWASPDIEELSVGFMAEFVGINDSTGAFIMEDWTTALAFEWDSETGELVVDDEDLLQVIDVTGAQELPVSYIRSYAYWYQDFPLLDLSNLSDGRPVDTGGAR